MQKYVKISGIPNVWYEKCFFTEER